MTANVLGKVFLVGAGPGDPDLLTLKGKRCLENADVILYDELVNRELMGYAAQHAELNYVGKKAGAHCVDQRDIEALLIHKARQGKTVVRLKGGDPFVFGRGGEEAEALRTAGIPYEIIPGVSSAIAVPAYAGIPVTHRSCASSVAIVTGHGAVDANSKVKWEELAQSVDTLVILMGLYNLRAIMLRLLGGGCAPGRPVALIQSGTGPKQRTLVGTVATIADLVDEQKFQSPTIIVVGEVVRLRGGLMWFEDKTSRKALLSSYDSEETTEGYLDRFQNCLELGHDHA
jgi:uroporphyrin-III C-methyltransferase